MNECTCVFLLDIIIDSITPKNCHRSAEINFLVPNQITPNLHIYSIVTRAQIYFKRLF